ncbi:hypothetical protein NMG60_11000382 [Bertholletia excelsa]
MDNKWLGDDFGGFGDKHSSGEGSFPASTSCDDVSINHKASKISNLLSINGSSAKKRRVSKGIDGGLRQLSIIVCKKVESKGRTTYNEVADAIIAEFTAKQNSSAVSLDEFGKKNIRRRVYDALNVLMALDIIIKDKKEIQWKGILGAKAKDMEQTKALCIKLTNQIRKKTAYLKELEEQIAGLQKLILRNKQLLKCGNVPSEGFSLALPFVVVRTSPRAKVEIEFSEDMQLVHFDFNSTPFSLHYEDYVLKLMPFYQLPHPESKLISWSSSILSSPKL